MTQLRYGRQTKDLHEATTSEHRQRKMADGSSNYRKTPEHLTAVPRPERRSQPPNQATCRRWCPASWPPKAPLRACSLGETPSGTEIPSDESCPCLGESGQRDAHHCIQPNHIYAQRCSSCKRAIAVSISLMQFCFVLQNGVEVAMIVWYIAFNAPKAADMSPLSQQYSAYSIVEKVATARSLYPCC